MYQEGKDEQQPVFLTLALRRWAPPVWRVGLCRASQCSQGASDTHPDHLLHGCVQGNSPLVQYTGFGLLAKYFVSKKPRFLICFHSHKPFKEDGELKPCCMAWSHFRWAARGTRLPTLGSFDKCMFPSVSLDLVRKSV